MSSDRLQVINRHLSFCKLGINPTRGTSLNSQLYEDDFRYTLNNPLLSYEQRKFYEENGYLVIPKLIEDELLDECSRRFVDYCNGVIPKGGITMMKDISLMKKGAKGEFLYNKIQDIFYESVFEKYFLHRKLLEYVSCFTGPNIKGLNSMIINKPPDSGALTSRHPLHQDLYYLPHRPIDRIVASWTAMDMITESNGCLFVLPGTHKVELQPHEYPQWEGGVNKAYHAISGYDNYFTVPLLMEKGDTVFFHPLLIHGSGANQSKGFRKAISCHFSTTNHYFIDVKGTIQEGIAKEVEAIARKKGFPGNIQEIWELKSRLVKGTDI